jgi:L-seryl-tRNA(Ser) seleniumtransferase
VRRGEVPAVVGRIEGGRLLLDLRTVPPAADEQLAVVVLAAAGNDAPQPAAPPVAVPASADGRSSPGWE